MSWFADEYAQMGLSDVVQVDSTSHEETSGYQNETETETVVARTAAGGFLRITAKRVHDFGPRGGVEKSLGQRDISEVEYAAMATNGVQVDLSDAEAHLAADAGKKTAHAQLVSTAPRCTAHDRKMILKSSTHGQFWGCPKFPACKRTDRLTTEQHRLSALSA